MAGGTLSERMAAVARELLAQHDPQATLESAVKVAVAELTGADAASISIVHKDKRVDTAAASDDMASRGDELQYETGEGPCLDAIWTERTVYSPSLGHDARWPTWGARVVAETGAESVLAFQLFTSGHSLGALNLYSQTRDGFKAADKEDGLALAAHIAIALAGSREIDQLGQALDSRTVIGQATGVLMERYSIDQVRAFAVLTRLSSTENVKLRDLATQIVAGLPTPEG
jgi:transcriptional regulator with GAF, ATPase, and Fis domain